VAELLQREQAAGVTTSAYYARFQAGAEKVKRDFARFLIDAKERSELVGAYGAAAKGNTLMNFAGVRSDLVAFVVDQNPAKQGKFMPGSRVPIVAEDWVRRGQPKFVVLFPWNIRNELAAQLGYIREWGGRFVVAVPRLEIF
jgi:hypothetical protein